MAFDPNRDYAKDISAAIASGASKETVARLNAERNEKIAASQAHYDAKGIGANDQYGTAAQNYVSGTATVPQGATAQAVPQAAAPSVTPQAAARTTDDLRALAAQSMQTRIPRADTSAIRGYMEQARDASVAHSGAQIDRAVTQSVNELARTREESAEQYRTELERVSAEEARNLDNRALYDAARGDRGGIGAEQYNAIMNTAAQNRVALNAARVKMSSEVSRQMAQLRAEGEYQKADAYFQATQQYMSQLAQLEQWEQEFNVSVEQFNAQMEQAYLNYLTQLRQLDISTEQWEREFAANREDTRWNQDFQAQQAATAREEWEREFAANREDTRWNQDFQTQQAATAREEWEREFAANREDTRWNQGVTERQLANEEANTAWQQLFQQGQADFQRQQYADTRADTEKQNALARAESMMNVGMMPDAATRKAAGLSTEYAQLYISAVKAAQELSSAQAAAELENKQADTLKKMTEARNTSGTSAASGGDLTALARAFIESKSTSPKTWLSNNYKSYGFTAKPDADEFEDTVDQIRAGASGTAETNAGPGMRQSVYAGYKKYIESVLNNGAADWETRAKAVTSRLDSMWAELDAEQRADLRSLLEKRGLNYIPD